MKNVKKLTRREFARALKLGHGRALLHVLHHGDGGVEDLIEKALIHNYVYDTQIEGSRRCYLEGLVRITGSIKAYAMCVLKSFDYKQKNWLDCSQQIYMCSFFFEQGFCEFRPMMFKKFEELVSFENPSVGCGRELVSVAGLSGLEFVANILGRDDTDADDYDCADILEHAECILNGSTIAERMKELSLTKPSVGAFMDAARRYTESKNSRTQTRTEQPVPTAEEFLESVRAAKPGRFFFNSIRFARNASDADIRKVFDSLFTARNLYEQKSLLKVFNYRTLPKFDSRIIEFLTSEDFSVRHSAADALGLLKHSAVRRQAIEMLTDKNSGHILLGMQMLKKNYRPSDPEMLLSALKKLKGSFDVHSAGMNLRNLAKEEGGKELAPCFLWLYEHGPDTFCRESFVELLVEWEQCPDEILFESQWDAGEELQMLARSHLNRREQHD